MKLLLFLCTALLCASTHGQELRPELKKFSEKQEFNKLFIIQKNIPHPSQLSFLPKIDTTPANYPGSFMLFRNGQPVSKDSRTVRVLPKDNMPCIVPDTKDIAKIPNAWPGKLGPYKGTIPNAAQPKLPKVEVQPNK